MALRSRFQHGTEVRDVEGTGGFDVVDDVQHWDGHRASMVAPHVSGAVAAFLSRSEFIAGPLDPASRNSLLQRKYRFGASPSFPHSVAMLSSPRKPSSTIRIFSSTENRRRVFRRISWTTFFWRCFLAHGLPPPPGRKCLLFLGSHWVKLGESAHSPRLQEVCSPRHAVVIENLAY
jgi:hypothetical protein